MAATSVVIPVHWLTGPIPSLRLCSTEAVPWLTAACISSAAAAAHGNGNRDLRPCNNRPHGLHTEAEQCGCDARSTPLLTCNASRRQVPGYVLDTPLGQPGHVRVHIVDELMCLRADRAPASASAVYRWTVVSWRPPSPILRARRCVPQPWQRVARTRQRWQCHLRLWQMHG